ncbi:MAG TPA: beta-ketoacyl synthase N-terminal-like domain-containing protein [Trebonia sp.]|nr:beta-ketoacyl synthase N-terminal-like domain-containing protein [Trebonia sp.]
MHVSDEPNTGPVQAVAIVGAALRFPGAADPPSFHNLSVTGQRMFRELARADDGEETGRGGHAGPPAPRPSPLAALLDEEIPSAGDPADGLTPRHTLAAETAAAALADVPSAGRAVAPGRIGVFIADTPEPGTTAVRDWVHWQLGLLMPGDAGTAAAGRPDVLVSGNGMAEVAGAGWEDPVIGSGGAVHRGHGAAVTGAASVTGTAALTGAALTGAAARTGTAARNGALTGDMRCSLRAVAAACEALNSGQFDLVLAGGVATGTDSWTRGTGVPAGGTRPAEWVRVYDTRPTGTLPGEGCGVVALTRAADARAVEVPAYAEIVGWCYGGAVVPQRPLLAEAYLRAGVDPADIQFVEGHGAATAMEDLAELSALLELLGGQVDGDGHCPLGSVSANIGDTRAAAGVAALLKTAFAMTADVIPPSTGCIRPNRLLRRTGAPLRLLSAPEQWPQTPVQLAAVNTLGTAPHPDAPRSGPVHVILRRERDRAHRPGRHRKPALLTAGPAIDIPRQARP